MECCWDERKALRSAILQPVSASLIPVCAKFGINALRAKQVDIRKRQELSFRFWAYFFIMKETPLLAYPRQASSLNRVASSHSSIG